MKNGAPKGTSGKMERRAFVGGFGVIAGTAACAGKGVAAEERHDAGVDPDDQRHLSYRETDHIRWFYRRARM